jgi:hypothetical protein
MTKTKQDRNDKAVMTEATGLLQSKEKHQRLIPHVWRKRLNNKDCTAEYSACSIIA